MKQSQLFTKTRHEIPTDEVAKNAQLLVRAGYIHKEVAGAYSFLPLGLRVLSKINNIIREEMNSAGGQEIYMTALQNPETWQATGRWDDKVVDNWFKSELKAGGQVGFGFTHEEPLTALVKHHISSYRDLPVFIYQIQTKFRNEMRAKSGLLRGREFLMKDLYSFSRGEAEHQIFYDKMKEVYNRVYERLGIGEKTFITFSSGGSFAKFSHEFQTIMPSGEDSIYVDYDKKLAVNEEVYTDEVLSNIGLDKNKMQKVNAAEVGNIFTLGTKFSKPLDLVYTDEKGATHPIFMGSYGIGLSRIMGVIVELFADDGGIVWPESVAPFKVHLLSLDGGDDELQKEAEEFYISLCKRGVEVLFDDRRDISAGEKFSDADLIGIPWRVVMSKRSREAGGVEVKARNDAESTVMSIEEVLNKFNS